MRMGAGRNFEYKGDDDKTNKSHDAEGYFTVGDVGYLNEDGYLFLCDRKSDMIIAGGINIYPAEIEGCIHEHPQVADVAVFGIPDDDMGEQIKAVVEGVILGAGRKAAPAERLGLDEGDVDRGDLSRYASPRRPASASAATAPRSGACISRRPIEGAASRPGAIA
jgi:long-chain acyl-CoA synthetase